MRLKLNFLIFLLFIIVTSATGQVIDSISMNMENGLAVVRYDFIQGEEGIDYELYLYGSHDNFSAPLQFTTGDVGKKIKTGIGKVIYWDAQKELGNFKGDFSLKIKGSKYIPFVTFTNLEQGQIIKRGNTFEIRWDTKEKMQMVLLKIQRHGVPVVDPQVVENTGSFIWDIPKNANVGDGYSVQIVDPENPLHEETSSVFDIRRKIPLAYKLAPLAVAAVAAVIILTDDAPDTGIPEPPGEPNL